MSIKITGGDSDITDNSTRQLGQVGIVSSYQDVYLPLILRQLRRIALLVNNSPLGRDATVYSASTALSSLTSKLTVLGADVAITSPNTYVDGPSVSCEAG